MQDIILEKNNFIIIRQGFKQTLINEFDNGTLEQKFFNKLVVPLPEVENLVDNPGYSNPLFFADPFAGAVGQILPDNAIKTQTLKKYYENNGITTKDETKSSGVPPKKYDILNINEDNNFQGITPGVPSGSKPYQKRFKIGILVFEEMNPNFLPKLSELFPITPQSAESESAEEKFTIDATIDQPPAPEPEPTNITTKVEKTTEDRYKNLGLSFLANSLDSANNHIFFISDKDNKLGDTFTLYGEVTPVTAPLKNAVIGHIKGIFEHNDIKYKKGNLDLFDALQNDTSTSQASLELKKNPPGSENTHRYSLVVSAKFIIAANPNFIDSKPTKDPAKGGQSADQQTRKKTNSVKHVTGQNSSTTQLGNRVAIYKFDDLATFTFITNRLLNLLDKKLKEFNAVLDKPINLTYQARQITRLQESLLRLINSNKESNFDKIKDYVKLKFDSEFKLLSIGTIKSEADGTPGGKTFIIFPKSTTAGGTSPVPSYFANQTTNSLVFNLSKMYNKHNKSFELNEGSRSTAGSSVFVSEELARQFLNNYMYPKTSITLSNVTRDIIEKFLIGDVRLVDDEFYKKYQQVNENQFSETLKANLFNEMSSQYENIADVLGEGWFSGQFKEINSVDQFYEELGDYFPLEQLIKVSVKCLFYLVPLDEWLDTICKPILEKFDEYNQYIIDELDSLGESDPIAKDIAKELKEIYLNRILEPAKQYGSGIVERGLRDGVKLLKEADQIYSWTTTTLLSSFIDRIAFGYKSVLNATDTSLAQEGIGAYQKQIEDTYLPNDIETRLKKLNNRKSELMENRDKLEEDLKIFEQQNIPEKFLEQRRYYNDQIQVLQIDISKLVDGQRNARDQTQIYSILFGNTGGAFESTENDKTQVLFNLTLIDPYLTEEEKAQVIKTEFVDNAIINKNGIYNLPAGVGSYSDLRDSAVETLRNITLPSNIKSLIEDPQANFEFTFPADYNARPLEERKNQFDINLANLKLLFEILHRLQQDSNSPYNVLADLEKFGTELFDETIDNLFGDPTKRRYLCLAIIGAVPAVGYLIYLLIKNYEQVGDFLEKEFTALGKAIKRKFDMLLRTDYPILDILDEVVDLFTQILINFTRDLIINGILYSLNQISSLCQDEEKINAPFNPVGGVDIADLLKKSKNGGSNQNINSLDKSNSFASITSIAPDFSASMYESILNLISSNFTNREACGLLGGNASGSLYDKALKIIKDSQIVKNTDFYDYYGTQDGIREFFKLVGRDFDFSFCAEAMNDFDKQKSILIEACFGTDDTFLSPPNLSNLDLKDLLSAKSEIRASALPALLDQMNNMFKPNKGPEKCDILPELTELEKFMGRETGKAIFGSIEESFDKSILSIEPVFQSLDSGLKQMSDSIMETYESTGQVPSVQAFLRNTSGRFAEAQRSREFIVPELLQDFIAYISESENLFIDKQNEDLTETKSISYDFENQIEGSEIKRKISFNFDVEANQLNFDFYLTVGEEDEGSDPVEKYIATYKNFDYFDFNKYGLQKAIPEDILFKGEDSISRQPKYKNQSLRDSLSDYARNENHYEKILNSIFIDFGTQSFKLGVYKNENFQKLDFTQNLSGKTIQTPDGIENLCFPGFMNKEILTEQMLKLASKINCLYNESATEVPLNIAALKISLDTFMRTVAFTEMIKSIFVFSLYPEDLVYLNEENSKEYSIFEQVLNLEVNQAVKRYFGNKYKHFGNFYNDVIRKFITDIMRAIFEDDTITDDFAYNFVINSQLQFVKLLMRETFKNAFPLSGVFDQTSQYQLLQSQKSLTGGDLQNSEIQNQTISTRAKLDFMVNDSLNFDYGMVSTLSNGQQILPVAPDAPGADPTGIVQDNPGLFFRVNPTEQQLLAYQENANALLEELGINSTGNRHGITIDNYIELSSNDSFYENYGGTFENFFKLLGKPLNSQFYNKSNNDGGDGGEEWETHLFTYASKLKGFLYETRLFMLFPQLINIIDSLDKPLSPPPLWFKYVKNQEFDLFYRFFNYNFDPNFFEKQDNIDWFKGFSETEAFDSVDFTLWGKIGLPDFKKLTNRMIYPYTDPDTNLDISKIQDIIVEPAPAEYYEKLIRPSVSDYVDFVLENNSLNNQLNDKNSRTKDFLSLFKNIDLKINPPEKYLTDLQTFIDFQFFGAVGTLGEGGIDGKTMLQWLYEKPVTEMIDINFSARLESNIGADDLPVGTSLTNLVTAEFDSRSINKEIFKSLDNLGGSEKDKLTFQYRKNMAQEKIGTFFTLNGLFFKQPLFELKQPIKNDLTWYDLFILIDKISYMNTENYQYPDDFIENTTNVNDIFFNNSSDIISYYYNVLANSFNSKKQVNTITKESYMSNYWFSIRNEHPKHATATSLREILTAIYVQPDGEAGSDAQSPGVSYKYILDNLTAESKNSFKVATPAEDTVSEGLRLYPPAPHLEDGADENMDINTYIAGKNTGVLTPEEYNVLVKGYLSQFASSPTGEYSIYLNSDGSFIEGINPFIKFKEFDSEGRPVEIGFVTVKTAMIDPLEPDYDPIDPSHTGPHVIGYGGKVPIGIPGGFARRDFNLIYPGADFDDGGVYEFDKKLLPPLTYFQDGDKPGVIIDNYFDLSDIYLPEIEKTKFAKGPRRGGLTMDKNDPNLEIIPMDIPTSFTQKDIFSILLNHEENEDKKITNINTFNDLYKVFFFKEQGTILALIHKILLEKNYPQVNFIMAPALKASSSALNAALAELNGDYQQTTDDSTTPEEELDVGKAFAQIGTMLGKLLLESLANTFDPTWKTPWFVPGPLTPIGIAAKLVSEPRDDGPPAESKLSTPPPPPTVEAICNDAFTEQSNFFINLLNENKKALEEDN